MLDQFRAAGYVQGFFDEVDSLLGRDAPFLILRHDIDMCLEHAARMAELEASQGVASTYFPMVRNELYNVFSSDGSAQIRRILAAGHKLGLHFDRAAYPDSTSVPDLAAACARECKLLEDWFDTPISVVSYHRPNAQILEGDPALSQPLPHTYEMRFRGDDITYISDSQGRWRYGHPLDSEAFKLRMSIQLLVHPIWWQDTATPSTTVLDQFASDHLHNAEQFLAANCKIYQPGVRNRNFNELGRSRETSS